MSIVKCSRCKRETNSATSNWWNRHWDVMKCYIAYEDGKEVLGCAFDMPLNKLTDFDSMMMHIAQEMLEEIWKGK